MKAEEFIRELHRAKPSEEELASYGLDNDEINDVIGGFSATLREHPHPITAEAGEVGRLVALFDCSKIQVGLIHFDTSIWHTETGYRFGTCEADPLFVTHDGAVVMHDHSVSGATPTRCATDTAHFLDALAEFLRIQSQRATWRHGIDAAVEKCRAASGELESGDFYQTLLAFLR